MGPRVISRKSCDAGYFCWFRMRKSAGPESGWLPSLMTSAVAATANSAVADNPMRRHSRRRSDASRIMIAPKP